MSDIRIDFVTNAAAAKPSVDAFNKALDDTGKAGEQAGSKLGGLWTSVTAGIVAYNLLERGARAAYDVFKDSIKEAADYEKAVVTLNATFAQSGRTMPGMVNNLKDYALKIEASGMACETTSMQAEALLLRMTHLNEAGIKEATRLAAGLAYTYKMDLNEAATLVGKGMEGVYRGFVSLAPEIMNVKTQGEKHTIMMKLLNDAYAAAEAQTKTYSGQVKALGLEWDDTKRKFGEAILSTGLLQASMKVLSDAANMAALIFKGAFGSREAEENIARLTEKENLACIALHAMGMEVGISNVQLVNQAIAGKVSWTQMQAFVLADYAGAAAQAALAKQLVLSTAGFTETGKAASGYSSEFIKARDALSAEIAKATLSDYDAEKKMAQMTYSAKVGSYEQLILKEGELDKLKAIAAGALGSQLIAIDKTYAQKIYEERSKLTASILQLGIGSYAAEKNAAFLDYVTKVELYRKTYGEGLAFDNLKAKSRQEMASKLSAIDRKQAAEEQEIYDADYQSAKETGEKIIALALYEQTKTTEINQMKRKLSMTVHDYNLSVIKDEETAEIAALNKSGTMGEDEYNRRLAIIKAYYAAKRALDTKDVTDTLACIEIVARGFSVMFEGFGRIADAKYAQMENDLERWKTAQQAALDASFNKDKEYAAAGTALDKEHNAASDALDKKHTAAKRAIEDNEALTDAERKAANRAEDDAYEAAKEALDVQGAAAKEKLAAKETANKDAQLKAQAALDKDYAAKKKQIDHAAAVSTKTQAIFNASISTAEAIAKALSGAPPPFNVALAAITAGLEAIQLAFIIATPIPLAKGAIFKSQTQLTSGSGQSYDVAEAGEAEILSSPRRLREAIMGQGGGSGRPIHVHVHNEIGGKLLNEQVIEIVQDASDTNRIKIKSRAVS